MTPKKEHIQYRLDEEVSDLLRIEAKRLGCGLNEAARYLTTRALRNNDGMSESLLRLSATTAYQLANFIVDSLKKQDPALTQEEVIKIANETIFTPSRVKADQYIASLGLGGKP